MGREVSTETNATFIQCDVAKPKEVESMCNEIHQKLGRLDVIFNNAGFGVDSVRLHEAPLENVTDLVAINQMGAWHVLK